MRVRNISEILVEILWQSRPQRQPKSFLRFFTNQGKSKAAYLKSYCSISPFQFSHWELTVKMLWIHHIYWNVTQQGPSRACDLSRRSSVLALLPLPKTIWQKAVSCLESTTFLHLWKQTNKSSFPPKSSQDPLSDLLSCRNQFSHGLLDASIREKANPPRPPLPTPPRWKWSL